jgi:hypothetical protein
MCLPLDYPLELSQAPAKPKKQRKGKAKKQFQFEKLVKNGKAKTKIETYPRLTKVRQAIES